MPPRVRVYIACSLDGYIAGPDDDLSWLQPPEGAPNSDDDAPPDALGFAEFMAQVGAMLMGRRTHDVIAGFGEWIYGDTPVLVATNRPLVPAADSVRPVSGDIQDLISQAKAAAGDKDVYLDGGTLIGQALDAELVDELCITLAPVLLGGGVRLFDGPLKRQSLRFVSHNTHPGGMVQITARTTRT